MADFNIADVSAELDPAHEYAGDEGWESTGSYALGLAVSELVGTSMHVDGESDEFGFIDPVATDEIRKLARVHDRGTFDWLIG